MVKSTQPKKTFSSENKKNILIDQDTIIKYKLFIIWLSANPQLGLNIE